MEYYDEEKVIHWANLRERKPTVDNYVLANIYDEEYGAQFKENSLVQIIAPLILLRNSAYADDICVCAREIKHPDRIKVYQLYYTTDSDDENTCVFSSSYFSYKYEEIVNGTIGNYFRDVKIKLGLNPDNMFSRNEEFENIYHDFYDHDKFGKKDHVSFTVLSEIREKLADYILDKIQEVLKGETAYVEIKQGTKMYFVCEIKADE